MASDMAAVMAALKKVEALVAQADGMDMVSKREAPEAEEGMDEDAADDVTVQDLTDIKKEAAADEVTPMTPEERRKLVGF